jgi:hypothetical protein
MLMLTFTFVVLLLMNELNEFSLALNLLELCYFLKLDFLYDLRAEDAAPTELGPAPFCNRFFFGKTCTIVL